MGVDWAIFAFSVVAAVIGWLTVRVMALERRLRSLWDYLFGPSSVPEAHRHGLARDIQEIKRELMEMRRELRRMNGKDHDEDKGEVS